jgi:hypothetical protein
MAGEHISTETFEQYRERLLPADRLLLMDDHLAECEACRLQMGNALKLASPSDLLLGLDAEPFEHPGYGQVAAYVDGQLDGVEREIVESHFACCTHCSTELQDLQTFKTQMTSGFSAPAISAPVVEIPQARRSTLREQAAAFVSAFRIPLQFAAAAACLALIAWAATVPLRRDIAELKTELAQSQQRNEELQREYEIATSNAGELQRQLAQLQPGNSSPQESVAIALNDGRLKVDEQGAIAGFTGAVDIPKDVWFHLRLVVAGVQAKLYVKDMDKPALVMDDLKSGIQKGQVALAALTGDLTFLDNDHFLVTLERLSNGEGAIITYRQADIETGSRGCDFRVMGTARLDTTTNTMTMPYRLKQLDCDNLRVGGILTGTKIS